MKKNNYPIYVLILLLSMVTACDSNSNKKISMKDTLQFAMFNQFNDMYPAKLFEYFKKHRIKTISFVSENLKTNKLDSLTYLEINNNGQLIKRTTKECTTIGCLRFMNRQEFHYLNGRITRIDVYTFKNDEQSTRSKWLAVDTSALKKYDWNDYSYKGDTIFVETAIAAYKFVNNSDDDMVLRHLRVKSTNQFIHNNITYTDSTIIVKIETSFNEVSTENYKYEGNRIELWYIKDKSPVLDYSWLFDSEGLINEKKYYEDGKVISNTHLSYTFYD